MAYAYTFTQGNPVERIAVCAVSSHVLCDDCPFSSNGMFAVELSKGSASKLGTTLAKHVVMRAGAR